MAIAIVSGVVANKHVNGGATWTRLSYALGLQRLGLDVCFIEQIDPRRCVDADGRLAPFAESQNLRYFQAVMERFGLAGHSTLICGDGEAVDGLSVKELYDAAESADCLINISGQLRWEPLLRRIRHRVYIDQDPGFTQFWHAQGTAGVGLLGHHDYFTVGENIGSPGCPIPTDGIRWRPTRQPVVLEEWPVTAAPEELRFTTIGSWRGPYGAVEYKGRTYGLKAHAFRKFIELPQRSRGTFELALDIHQADAKDRQALEACGWRIVDPKVATSDPEAFRRYVQASGAECSVAQGIYVDTASGWFSDRTVRYLASGKPALVQDTGFSRNLPVGEGLVPFQTLEEAVRGAESIIGDYARHAHAARRLAQDYFDSDTVLGRLLDEIGVRR